MYWFKMLATIELDYEIRSMADEIDDVWTNRGLAPKAGTHHTVSSQRRPDFALGIGRICAQLPRSHALLRRNSPARWLRDLRHDRSHFRTRVPPPHPPPPPPRGGRGVSPRLALPPALRRMPLT